MGEESRSGAVRFHSGGERDNGGESGGEDVLPRGVTRLHSRPGGPAEVEEDKARAGARGGGMLCEAASGTGQHTGRLHSTLRIPHGNRLMERREEGERERKEGGRREGEGEREDERRGRERGEGGGERGRVGGRRVRAAHL